MTWLLNKTDEELGKLARQVLVMYEEYDDEQKRMGTTTATMALLGSIIDVNATNFSFKLYKFHDNEKQYGDWEIKIYKSRTLKQKIKDFFTVQKKGLLTKFETTQDFKTKETHIKETWT